MIDFSTIKIVDSSLRNYQQKGKEAIYEAWKVHSSVMYQMPTGTGKTRLFVSIAKDIYNLSRENQKQSKVLILAHREELIKQISDNLGRQYGLAHGIIKDGYSEDTKMPIQIASVQSLKRRMKQWGFIFFDFIIIDEAHHALASTYKSICESYPSAKILGVTATPYRLSGQGFKSMFETLITSDSIEEFITNNYLCSYKYFSIAPSSMMQRLIDEIDVFDASGDYAERAMLLNCNTAKVRAKIVESYLKYVKGKKGIIYTINREHNIQICKEFNAIGIKAMHIDSKTPLKERNSIVNQFKNGQIDILCNVNIFSEGFDCPDVEFILLARPTKSLSLYLQQVGRGFRTSQNKDFVIFLDNVGAYNTFGLPSAKRQWKRHFEGNIEMYSPPTKSDVNFVSGASSNVVEGNDDLILIHDTLLCEPNSKKEEKTHLPNKIENPTIFYIDSDDMLSRLEDENLMQFGRIEYETTHNTAQYRECISEYNKIKSIKLNLKTHLSNSCYTVYKSENDWISNMFSAVYDVDISEEQAAKYNNYIERCIKCTVNDKWGIYDSEAAEWKMLPIYDEIAYPDSLNNIICKKGDQYGVINGSSWTEVLPFTYDTIEHAFANTFIVKKENLCGVAYNSKILIEIKYSFIICCRGHYFVESNNVYEIYDTYFENLSSKITNPKKLFKNYFMANFNVNTYGEKYTAKEIIVNKFNQVLFPCYFDLCHLTTDKEQTLIYFTIQNDCGFLDENLNIVGQIQKCQQINIKSRNLGKKVKAQRIRTTLNPPADKVLIYEDEKNISEVDFIPKAKKPIKTNTQKENGVINKNCKFGYSLNGKEVLECKYDGIDQVNKNTFIVNQSNKYGVYSIYESGVLPLIPIIYDDIQLIKKNYYIVSKCGLKGIISTGRGNIRIVKKIIYSDIVYLEERQHLALCQNSHHKFIKISRLV